ncbi:MAG: CDP-glycerol glycerophosphotransferase family protein [Lachnospiraceae bacterium]|nr:CDP-glycerol glycerophosphotransferase family protein [Lachnospiraceae bacterium]
MDVRLIFYPHTELQKELFRFSSPSDRIILADQAHYDVQTLLLRCSLLVTDYSSVFFDVGYQGKPVIYYQFDEEEYRRYLYAEGYFSYRHDGFGPVVETEEALLAALAACAESGFAQPQEYAERVERFFPMRDDKNCERTYHAILALSGRGAKS